jgi:hypothetical protein
VVVTDVAGRGWLACWPCFLNICAAEASAAKGLTGALFVVVGGGVSVGARGVLTFPLPWPCLGPEGLSSPALGFGTQESSLPAAMMLPKVDSTTLRGAVLFVGAGLATGWAEEEEEAVGFLVRLVKESRLAEETRALSAASWAAAILKSGCPKRGASAWATSSPTRLKGATFSPSRRTLPAIGPKILGSCLGVKAFLADDDALRRLPIPLEIVREALLMAGGAGGVPPLAKMLPGESARG